MKQIDNKKMWESLIKTLENGDLFLYSKELISALKDQGFEYKGGKITEINETSDFKIESDKYYMCIKDFVIGGQERFYKGSLYKSDIDECVTDKNGFQYNSFSSDAAEYFRPATPEEILKVKYGITGISSKKTEGNLGEMIKELYNKDPENFTCKLYADTEC